MEHMKDTLQWERKITFTQIARDNYSLSNQTKFADAWLVHNETLDNFSTHFTSALHQIVFQLCLYCITPKSSKRFSTSNCANRINRKLHFPSTDLHPSKRIWSLAMKPPTEMCNLSPIRCILLQAGSACMQMRVNGSWTTNIITDPLGSSNGRRSPDTFATACITVIGVTLTHFSVKLKIRQISIVIGHGTLMVCLILLRYNTRMSQRSVRFKKNVSISQCAILLLRSFYTGAVRPSAPRYWLSFFVVIAATTRVTSSFAQFHFLFSFHCFSVLFALRLIAELCNHFCQNLMTNVYAINTWSMVCLQVVAVNIKANTGSVLIPSLGLGQVWALCQIDCFNIVMSKFTII